MHHAECAVALSRVLAHQQKLAYAPSSSLLDNIRSTHPCTSSHPLPTNTSSNQHIPLHMTRIIEIRKIESLEGNETENEGKDFPCYQFRPIEINFDQDVIHRTRAAVNYFKNIMLCKESSSEIQKNEEKKHEQNISLKVFTNAAFETEHSCKRMKK